MKDPTSELHTAYFTLLNGNVSVSSTKIPVYKWERPGNETRIELSTTVLEEDGSKDTHGFIVQQNVTIISSLRMPDERTVADNISNEVVNLVVTDSLMTLTSFDLLDANLSAAEVFEDESYDNTTYRKELTFNHLIYEK